MLYLENCIISIYNSNFQIFFKKYFLHFNSFENIMENGTFTTPFFIIFSKNLTFQRCPKALVWSKGLIFGPEQDLSTPRQRVKVLR